MLLFSSDSQVCQETTPDICEGPVPSVPTLLNPSLSSHASLDPDLASQPEPPIIHDMVTSSPTDNEQLAAMPFVTHVDLVVPLDASFTEPPPSEVELELSPVPESSPLDTHTDTGPVPESIALETSAPSAEHDISIHTETPTPTGPPSDTVTDIGPAPEPHAAPESPAPDSPPPDTIGSEDAAQEPSLETVETELPEKVTHIPKEKGMHVYTRLEIRKNLLRYDIQLTLELLAFSTYKYLLENAVWSPFKPTPDSPTVL